MTLKGHREFMVFCSKVKSIVAISWISCWFHLSNLTFWSEAKDLRERLTKMYRRSSDLVPENHTVNQNIITQNQFYHRVHCYQYGTGSLFSPKPPWRLCSINYRQIFNHVFKHNCSALLKKGNVTCPQIFVFCHPIKDSPQNLKIRKMAL